MNASVVGSLMESKLLLAPTDEATFVLQRVQPALLGLMDGSVSTLVPLFAAAGLTHSAHAAFFVGLAASVGAGISMGLAEALSDDSRVTGRGNPWVRGLITGTATTLGGMLHTLPFLIPGLGLALHVAYAVVGIELLLIAYIRFRFMKTLLASTIFQVIIGGALCSALACGWGRWGRVGRRPWPVARSGLTQILTRAFSVFSVSV